MIETCARKGFAAVEYDNLDSWTRFDGTPRAGDVPFGKRQAIAYAALLARRAHALGLAVGQKNTPSLTSRQARRRVGFDFAIAEECGRFAECGRYRALFGNRVIAIEYRRQRLQAGLPLGRETSRWSCDRDRVGQLPRTSLAGYSKSTLRRWGGTSPRDQVAQADPVVRRPRPGRRSTPKID